MATAIIHAGMGKTGSSSIQLWLAANMNILSEKYGTNVLRAYVRSDEETGRLKCILQQVEEDTHSDSNELVQASHSMVAEEKHAFYASFYSQLRDFLDRGINVIISAEAFYTLLVNYNHAFLTPLNNIAENHNVHVAYYVRPQDEAMESAWRQWGFRTNMAPHKYLLSYEKSLHYYNTYLKLIEVAPKVKFTLRPYRNDLLSSGNVVTDFVNNILGLNEAEFTNSRSVWVNPTLPLEIVNLMRALPRNVLWSSPHDNIKLNRLKRIFAFDDGDGSERTRKSRQIIKNYCYSKFEKENESMLHEMKWGADEFITGLNNKESALGGKLEEVDELWKTKASRAELEFIARLLENIEDIDAGAK